MTYYTQKELIAADRARPHRLAGVRQLIDQFDHNVHYTEKEKNDLYEFGRALFEMWEMDFIRLREI